MRAVTKNVPAKIAVGLAAVGLVSYGATALASIPSSNGTIYGCYAKSGGATRIIDPGKQKCSTTENPISWSQRGPRGFRGLPGQDGQDGVSGYEQVLLTYDDQALPDNKSYTANCPTGKKVFGGGAVVQLFDDEGPVGLGDPPQFS